MLQYFQFGFVYKYWWLLNPGQTGVWVCSTTTPVAPGQAPWHLLGVPSFTSFASFPCQSLPCLYLGVLLDYLSTRFLASLTLDLWLVLMSFSLFYISPNESSRTLAIIKPAKWRPTAIDIGPKIRARWTRDNSKSCVITEVDCQSTSCSPYLWPRVSCVTTPICDVGHVTSYTSYMTHQFQSCSRSVRMTVRRTLFLSSEVLALPHIQ